MMEIFDSSKKRSFGFWARAWAMLLAVFSFFIAIAILMVTGITETISLTGSYGVLAGASFGALFSLWRMTVYLRVLLKKEEEN